MVRGVGGGLARQVVLSIAERWSRRRPNWSWAFAECSRFICVLQPIESLAWFWHPRQAQIVLAGQHVRGRCLASELRAASRATGEYLVLIRHIPGDRRLYSPSPAACHLATGSEPVSTTISPAQASKTIGELVILLRNGFNTSRQTPSRRRQMSPGSRLSQAFASDFQGPSMCSLLELARHPSRLNIVPADIVPRYRASRPVTPFVARFSTSVVWRAIQVYRNPKRERGSVLGSFAPPACASGYDFPRNEHCR